MPAGGFAAADADGRGEVTAAEVRRAFLSSKEGWQRDCAFQESEKHRAYL